MRRSTARIAQLRAHLRRRRHDAQALEAIAVLLATQPDPRPPSAFDLIYRRYYSDRHLRKLARQLTRTLYS